MADRGQMNHPLRLLITGGGTGGHLFPAVAAAQALRSQQPDSDVLFIGTHRKIDTTSLQTYGFSSSSIYCHGLKGKNLVELIKAMAVLPISFLQAVARIRKFRPDVALGVGGYVTGPVMLAAKFLGVPTIVHEQNSIPGMANRKLGAIVDYVCISLPGSETFFPAEKVVMTGNPVRENILELSRREKLQPARKNTFTMLVLGGSQGAHALNKVVTETICEGVAKGLTGLSIIHQTGKKDEEWVKEQYRQAGIKATVAGFFQNMKEVYEQADFLVSRAGATTLTEIAVLGKPAIVVPYPYAADDHQQRNAEYYAKNGGVLQIDESELNSLKLRHILRELTESKEKLQSMGVAMRKLGTPEAAEKIIDVCINAALRKRGVDSQPVSHPGE